MHVERTERSIGELTDQISSAEIRLPEIQREYVWKPTQVAKLMDSIYRGYPFGSLLFWQTDDMPEIREMAVTGLDARPARPPLFLLDGQQRLTSLHRVFTDHPEAQIVFHVEGERFQNQSAATRRDPKWIKVYDVLNPEASMLRITQQMLDAGTSLPDHEIERRLSKVKQLRNGRFMMEVLKGFPYEEVAEIFVRVNSGGRRLGTLDLAMATLSTRWTGVLAKLEREADYWRSQGYGGIDVNFLSRALAGVVLGRGLSAYSHSRLRQAKDVELERGWAVVRRGLRRLVPLLRSQLRLTRSDPLPSLVVLIPIVVVLGRPDEEPTDRDTINGIIYWLLIATVRTRYSGSTDTRLSQDIQAAEKGDGAVRALLENLDVEHSRVEVTERALAGRTKESSYFFLSLLVTQLNGARDWWFGSDILPGVDSERGIEQHHIHPPATLAEAYEKAEINDLANLAFISGKANKKIAGRSPSEYFAELSKDELAAHLVPLAEELRHPGAYRDFLAARRGLLARAMNELLDRFRPAWLDAAPAVPSDTTTGLSLDLALYESPWEDGRMVFVATGEGIDWTGSARMADLENAIESARIAGIDSDLEIAGESVPVRIAEDSVEVPVGPFMVVGTPDEWRSVLDRERASARPMSAMPEIPPIPWSGEHIRFPVTNTE